MTYNVDKEAGLAGEGSISEILKNFLRESVIGAIPESKSCFSILEREEHCSEIVFHDIAGAAPVHVKVDHIKQLTLARGDLVEMFGCFDFLNDLLERFRRH